MRSAPLENLLTGELNLAFQSAKHMLCFHTLDPQKLPYTELCH